MYNLLKTGLILAAYALVTIATSYSNSGNQLTNVRTFSISSNCSNATLTSGLISVVNTDIVSPSGITFLNLGLPTASISLGQDVSAEIAPALIRACVYTSNTVLGVTTGTYTCSDNSIPACVVELTPH